MNIVPSRLAQKLILSLTIIVIIVAGVSGFLNVKTQERQLLDAMVLGADQLSNGITSATWHAMLADDREAAYEVMQTIATKQGIDRIRIFNRDGKIMFSTRHEENEQVEKNAEPCSPCHTTLHPLSKVDIPSRARIFDNPDGSRRLTMITPIYNEPSCSQGVCHAHPAETKVLGVLDVALDLDRVDKEVANVRNSVFAVTGVEILLIALFIIFFTRNFVDIPIRKLIDGTRAVSAMNLDQPIDIKASEELSVLAKSFNTMRERLKRSIDENVQFTQSLETKVDERTAQLKAAHQKLLQSDRLASLGQLSASVAHEINNPLSGVLNLSMLMQRILKDNGIPPDRIEEFRKYLSQVVNETSRVGHIVSDLLAFSRRSKPQSSIADLNGIVKTTLALISHKLKLMNVETELTLEQQLPAVQCDGSQMQQVVLNLVMNGAEATLSKGGGKVSINTRSVPKENSVILEVQDTGDGISPENLSKIFDPFFTTKGEGKGVGLGLAVVYGIVEAHRGDIEVKSKPGEGTTFIVTLPLLNEERPQIPGTVATSEMERMG
ncbi:MAG: ATP-binding protein [Bacteroidota bacterium]